MNITGPHRFLMMEQYKSMHEIFPSDNVEKRGALWLGDYKAALDKDFLDYKGIRTVLTAASGLNVSYTQASRIEHHVWQMIDHPSFNIARFFEDVIQEIEEGLRRGGVLVHCAAGISRSASCVIAYLMQKKGMSFSTAIHLVKSERRIVQPNIGFIKQLQMFERHLVMTKKDYKKKAKLPHNILSNSKNQDSEFKKSSGIIESDRTFGRSLKYKNINPSDNGDAESQRNRMITETDFRKTFGGSEQLPGFATNHQEKPLVEKSEIEVLKNYLFRKDQKQLIGILKNGNKSQHQIQQNNELQQMPIFNKTSKSMSLFDQTPPLKTSRNTLLATLNMKKKEQLDVEEKLNYSHYIRGNESSRLQEIGMNSTINEQEVIKEDRRNKIQLESLKFQEGRRRGHTLAQSVGKPTTGFIGVSSFLKQQNLQGVTQKNENNENSQGQEVVSKIFYDLPFQQSTATQNQLFDSLKCKSKEKKQKSVTIRLPSKEGNSSNSSSANNLPSFLSK